jgi:hypothetical protein
LWLLFYCFNSKKETTNAKQNKTKNKIESQKQYKRFFVFFFGCIVTTTKLHKNKNKNKKQQKYIDIGAITSNSIL